MILFCAQANAQNTLTLQEALQAAKENNPVLKAESLNIKIAETEVKTAQIRPNPTIETETTQMSKHRHFLPGTKWHNRANRKENWQLTKPLQIAGQRRHRIEMANKNVILAEKDYFDTERMLFAEVAEKWLDVWAAQKQADIIRIAKENIDSLMLANQIRYKNQVITKTDLHRTELLARQYEIQYKTVLQEIANSRNELKLLTGIQENMEVDTADNMLFVIPQNMDDLLEEALENRSDIQIAQALKEVSGSNIKLQKSLAYPQPEIGLAYEGEQAETFFGISAAIDLPLFNRNQGEIQKSQLLKEQAESQLFSVQNRVITEITVAFDNYKLQQQNIENSRELLNQSNEILENVKYTYIRGGTTIIDFLEAQRSWLETRQQYYETMQEYRKSYIQLLYATGLINQLAQ